MRIAVYPGSFDPITNGHIDIIQRVHGLFDRLIVAVLNNPDKRPLFSVAERMDLISAALGHLPQLEVDSFEGLLVRYASVQKADVIIRGLRESSDFENELRMAQMNRELDDSSLTLFVPTDARTAFISSSLVKQIAAYEGDVSKFVPGPVAQALQKKYSAN